MARTARQLAALGVTIAFAISGGSDRSLLQECPACLRHTVWHETPSCGASIDAPQDLVVRDALSLELGQDELEHKLKGKKLFEKETFSIVWHNRQSPRCAVAWHIRRRSETRLSPLLRRSESCNVYRN
jgi:hypothetical protein